MLRPSDCVKQELEQLHQARLKLSTGSPVSVWPRHRLCMQLVQIPVGVVNGSVPSNGSVFAFHLSRLAVRLYAALAQLLYEGTVYELEIPLYFTEVAERTLDSVIGCLTQDVGNRFPHGLKPDRVRNALLEQVLALQLGFLAFRRLLALFFVYYTLDNCELSDAVYESCQFETERRLPAAARVNMARRHCTQFAHAFQCATGSPMAAGEVCRVLR
ncbi:hypothetical protein HPB48_020026 [Haemaphysalis longicornis]|uniref:Uncharacterized protein n=1 Tax=Haemaphysalis longicornis TaxID=44386 RepID=A0A9J6GNN0_HAELO|nr:hypothetical protein HPB48_020026 [Haemaphysalis longicornis]